MNLYQKYGFKVWFKQLGGVESSVTTPVVKSMTLPIAESTYFTADLLSIGLDTFNRFKLL
jgi:hypothetical protein